MRISKPGDCLPPKVAGKTNKNSKEIGDDDSLWRSPHQTCQAIMVTWTLEKQGLYISLKIMRFFVM